MDVSPKPTYQIIRRHNGKEREINGPAKVMRIRIYKLTRYTANEDATWEAKF